LDSAFIIRSLRTAVALALLGFVLGAYYLNFAAGVGFLLGALWSIANLYLIKVLIEKVITLAKRPAGPVALLVLVKFPLLYGLGFLVLSWGWYDVLAPLCGFSLPFVVVVLKAAGRLWLGIDGPDAGRKPLGAGLKR
jgi:hypothetical protein